jgi:hypothetical protein
MAIKIDLLPGYVQLERRLNLAIIICVALTAVVVSSLLVALEQKKLALQTLTQNREAADAQAALTTAAESATSTLTAETAPLSGTSEWMLAASKTGAERAALLNLVRQYIYPNSVVSAIDISDGQKVTISATVRDPDEYRAFLTTLRRASDQNNGPLFAGLPNAAGVGGFANGAAKFVPPVLAPGSDPVVISYPINVQAIGNLKNPVVLPPDPTTGAAPAAPVEPGMEGMEGAPPAP